MAWCFCDICDYKDKCNILIENIEHKNKQRMKEERCCGNCHWFDNEDVYGVGWCSNNEHESSCDQVCDEHEF